MTEQLKIALLDNINNNIIEEKVIKKPQTYNQLITEIKNNFKYLPDSFNISFPSSDNEIEIHSNEEYQLSKDVIFIHLTGAGDTSIFETNYNKLSDSCKDLLDCQSYICLICSDIIKNEKPLFCYTCQKLFHHKCLKNWDKQRKVNNKVLTCPICQETVPLEKWREKLDFEENRKNITELMKKFNSLKIENIKQNEIIQKYSQNLRKVLNLFINLLNKINELHTLVRPNNNMKLKNLINQLQSKLNLIINPPIDDIYSVFLHEFDTLEKYIIKKKNSDFINIDKPDIIDKIEDPFKHNIMALDLNKNGHNHKYSNTSECQKRIPFFSNIQEKTSIDLKEKKTVCITNLKFNNGVKEFKNEINLTYSVKNKGIVNIFGEQFFENNKGNIELIINGEKIEPVDRCKLNRGENNITIILKKKNIDFSYMFYGCKSLKNIDDLKNLDIEEIENLSHMFYNCSSLSNIQSLKNWNVSNCKDFSYMFYGCSSLSDIEPIQNWNVSNCINLEYMFYGCSSLSDIKPLKNWDISKVNNFEGMFFGCKSLENLKYLHNWNILKGSNILNTFYESPH